MYVHVCHHLLRLCVSSIAGLRRGGNLLLFLAVCLDTVCIHVRRCRLPVGTLRPPHMYSSCSFSFPLLSIPAAAAAALSLHHSTQTQTHTRSTQRCIQAAHTHSKCTHMHYSLSCIRAYKTDNIQESISHIIVLEVASFKSLLT